MRGCEGVRTLWKCSDTFSSKAHINGLGAPGLVHNVLPILLAGLLHGSTEGRFDAAKVHMGSIGSRFSLSLTHTLSLSLSLSFLPFFFLIQSPCFLGVQSNFHFLF